MNINQFYTCFRELLKDFSNEENHFLYSTATKFILVTVTVFSSNSWFYDFDATRFQKTLKFLDILVFLVPVDILSHYPNIDSSQWFKENVQ